MMLNQVKFDLVGFAWWDLPGGICVVEYGLTGFVIPSPGVPDL